MPKLANRNRKLETMAITLTESAADRVQKFLANRGVHAGILG